jgi:hypothetical protein
MKGSHGAYHRHGQEEASLHQTERARLQALAVLKVKTEREQQRTGKGG